jgi:hypothetical protein
MLTDSWMLLLAMNHSMGQDQNMTHEQTLLQTLSLSHGKVNFVN